MGKISKEAMKRHNKALELLKSDELKYADIEYVYEHYHEGATNMNNLVSAHFTPYELAVSVAQNVRYDNFVDLCAGIGILSWAIFRQYSLWSTDKYPHIGVCIELNRDYYEVGKKLLPMFHWINGDITDPEVIEEVKSIMDGKEFSIVSNPPYGGQVKVNTKGLLKYTKKEFEYKAIEVGALMGAEDGVFLIAQNSCPFRLSGPEGARGDTCHPRWKSDKYNVFVEQTGLEIYPNPGWCTDLQEGSWKDVNIVTEIAIVNYFELEYISIEDSKVKHLTLF